MSKDQSYIEVTGSAEYSQEIERYVIELRLAARASIGDVALTEVGALRARVIDGLLAAGLRTEELIEGGTHAWAPWFWRKKVGQEATYKIIIKCQELGRALQAIDTLEPLFSNQRHTLSVDMQQPHFRHNSDATDAARRDAVRMARHKAESVAVECGVTLGTVLQIEELTGYTRRSGMYGDEWTWCAEALGAPAGAAEPRPYESLAPAQRHTTLLVRVRFAIAT